MHMIVLIHNRHAAAHHLYGNPSSVPHYFTRNLNSNLQHKISAKADGYDPNLSALRNVFN